ncbi:MAG: hypothetical protein WBA57_13065 [Elainellaceae cyanobacterium]
MKRSLSLLLILLSVGSAGILAACSDPSASSDSALSESVDAMPSEENASSEGIALNEQQQVYVDEVKAELESFEQSISELEAKDPQPDGLRRLSKRYEAAQVALAELESGDMPWREARKEVNQAMRRLKRVSEKVEAN